MPNKNRISVFISGKEYHIVGEETDEYMQRIALYADKKISAILKENPRLSTQMAAVLTAINVTDDFFKVREREALYETEINELKQNVNKLIKENNKLKMDKEKMDKEKNAIHLSLIKKEAELTEVRNSLLRKNLR